MLGSDDPEISRPPVSGASHYLHASRLLFEFAHPRPKGDGGGASGPAAGRAQVDTQDCSEQADVDPPVAFIHGEVVVTDCDHRMREREGTDDRSDPVTPVHRGASHFGQIEASPPLELGQLFVGRRLRSEVGAGSLAELSGQVVESLSHGFRDIPRFSQPQRRLSNVAPEWV